MSWKQQKKKIKKNAQAVVNFNKGLKQNFEDGNKNKHNNNYVRTLQPDDAHHHQYHFVESILGGNGDEEECDDDDVSLIK